MPGHRPAGFRASGDRLRAGTLAAGIEIAEALSRQLPQSRRLPRGLHGGDRQALAAVLKPKWLRIGGYWYPRGGIPIDVFWQTGKLPKGCGCPIRASRPIAAAAEPLQRLSRSRAAAAARARSENQMRRRMQQGRHFPT